MFLGQYEHSIDEKGRMTIPARFRELLENGAYISQGLDQNLMVMKASDFETIYEQINKKSLTDVAARQLKRLIFSHADRLEVDRAGRILIPQFLRQSAQLDGEAIVVGVGNFFEIWSPDNWARQDALLQDQDANASRFAALDISISE